MTREHALQAMIDGEKVTNPYFTDDEYIYMMNNHIWSEDGYNFGTVNDEFWQAKVNNQSFDDNWWIYTGEE